MIEHTEVTSTTSGGLEATHSRESSTSRSGTGGGATATGRYWKLACQRVKHILGLILLETHDFHECIGDQKSKVGEVDTKGSQKPVDADAENGGTSIERVNKGYLKSVQR